MQQFVLSLVKYSPFERFCNGQQCIYRLSSAFHVECLIFYHQIIQLNFWLFWQGKQRQPTGSESVQCQTEERRRGEAGAARDTPGYIGGYTCNGGHAPEDNSALYPDFARSLLSLSSLKKLPCLYCKKWIVVSVLLCMNTVHGVHGVSWFWQFPRF